MKTAFFFFCNYLMYCSLNTQKYLKLHLKRHGRLSKNNNFIPKKIPQVLRQKCLTKPERKRKIVIKIFDQNTHKVWKYHKIIIITFDNVFEFQKHFHFCLFKADFMIMFLLLFYYFLTKILLKFYDIFLSFFNNDFSILCHC